MRQMLLIWLFVSSLAIANQVDFLPTERIRITFKKPLDDGVNLPPIIIQGKVFMVPQDLVLNEGTILSNDDLYFPIKQFYVEKIREIRRLADKGTVISDEYIDKFVSEDSKDVYLERFSNLSDDALGRFIEYNENLKSQTVYAYWTEGDVWYVLQKANENGTIFAQLFVVEEGRLKAAYHDDSSEASISLMRYLMEHDLTQIKIEYLDREVGSQNSSVERDFSSETGERNSINWLLVIAISVLIATVWMVFSRYVRK